MTDRVAAIVSRFVTGSAQSFNRQTNVDLTNKYIVLDLSELKGKLLPVGMMIALDYVWDNIKADRTKKKAIMIDEIWQLIGASSNKLAAEFCLEIFKVIRGYGGAAIAAIGLVMTIAGSVLLGIIAVIAGVAMILNYFSKKKKVETTRQNIESQFENKRTNGIQVIRALLAEIVDFRGEFAQKDGESEKVTAFLEQITPDQYVRKLADSNRRIKVNR